MYAIFFFQTGLLLTFFGLCRYIKEDLIIPHVSLGNRSFHLIYLADLVTHAALYVL
jgi:7,8-dihydro-6-hydroxymethylpterin-pyrophosphokinase